MLFESAVLTEEIVGTRLGGRVLQLPRHVEVQGCFGILTDGTRAYRYAEKAQAEPGASKKPQSKHNCLKQVSRYQVRYGARLHC